MDWGSYLHEIDREFNWKCFLCGNWALNGADLELQVLQSYQLTHLDDDCSEWVKCTECAKCYHAECLEITESDLKYPFACCKYSAGLFEHLLCFACSGDGST
jgi:hypothetical protein